VHYEGALKFDPETGEAAEVAKESYEAVVQCLDCLYDQSHLALSSTAGTVLRGGARLRLDDRAEANGVSIRTPDRRRLRRRQGLPAPPPGRWHQD
jgi:hypothetical protein